MFLVFDEVQRGIYKRSSAVSTAGEMINGENNQPEMHIDGPLEIKGLMNIALFCCCVHPKSKMSSPSMSKPVGLFVLCGTLTMRNNKYDWNNHIFFWGGGGGELFL